jgi:hypothetical protein
MKYGPDIAPWINTCSAARECPMKESRLSRTDFEYNWDYDITYCAWFDSKVKVSDDPFLKTIRRKDNWLHRHMVHHFYSITLKDIRFSWTIAFRLCTVNFVRSL